MLRSAQIAHHETQLLALTGLTRQEFQDLVPIFQASFTQYLAAQTIDGLERIGRSYTSYRNSPLPTVEDKLLFILVYLKQAPTQTLHGQLFGMSQSNANKWIHLLHAVLNQALALHGSLPARTATISEEAASAASASDGTTFFSMTEPNGPSIGQATRMNNASTTAARKNNIPSKTCC